MIASALLALAAAHVVRAQVSTASLFPVGFMDDNLRGEAIGTGVDGTTYALSGTFDELDIPYTMTLVQDDTHVSITAALETAGITVPVNVQCEINANDDAVCEQVVGSGIDATSFTESGAVFLTPVPVGPDAGSVLPTGTATTRTPSITFSSDPLNTGTVLPPSISVPRSTGTATLLDPSETDESVPDIASGAASLKNGIVVVLGLIVPAVLSAALLN